MKDLYNDNIAVTIETYRDEPVVGLEVHDRTKRTTSAAVLTPKGARKLAKKLKRVARNAKECR